MARPIKETPILKGQDAINFLNEIHKPKKISEAEIQRIKNNAAKFKFEISEPIM